MSLSRTLTKPPFFFSDVEDAIEEVLTGRHSMIPTSSALTERQGSGRGLKPRMNLYEDNKSNMATVTLELPGLSKENVNIEVNNERLIVSGEMKRESEKSEEGFVVKECNTGRFSRVIGLPPNTQANAVDAHMENGLLTIKYPKSSHGQEAHRISIK